MAALVQLDGAEKVIIRLADFPVRLRSEIRPRLIEAGNHTADDMRRRAGSSDRIPGAIQVKASFATGARQGVRISVDMGRAPHALVHAKSAPFRHPVYGNRNVWRTQQPLNFWSPAIKVGANETRQQMEAALRAAVNR